MELITSIPEMRTYSSALKKSGKSVALVPTMGALHAGHLSLLTIARRFCDAAVMSVFVNPAQFGPAEDFAKYPRDLDRDRALAESAGCGCGCVFAPSADEMYPDGYTTYVDVGPVGDTLCGAARPGHFRGVATVVLKLFNIVSPHAAVFGAKDAQQVAVIKNVVDDLNVPVKIITAPIVREEDGLAMSSRNAYLAPAERRRAADISKALFGAKKLFDNGERVAGRIKDYIVSIIKGGGDGLIQIEYVEIVDPETMRAVGGAGADIEEGAAVMIAVACRTGESGTRLIDNVVLRGGGRLKD